MMSSTYAHATTHILDVMVDDHETIPEAVARHRRQTGRRGWIVLTRLPKRRAA